MICQNLGVPWHPRHPRHPQGRHPCDVHIRERRSKQKKDGSFYFFFAELALLMPFGIIFRLAIQLKHNLDPLIENKIKGFFSLNKMYGRRKGLKLGGQGQMVTQWPIFTQTGKIGSGKNTKYLFFLLGLGFQLRSNCTKQMPIYNLFVTSKNEITNSPILQFTNLKCCIKSREPFKTPN